MGESTQALGQPKVVPMVAEVEDQFLCADCGAPSGGFERCGFCELDAMGEEEYEKNAEARADDEDMRLRQGGP